MPHLEGWPVRIDRLGLSRLTAIIAINNPQLQASQK